MERRAAIVVPRREMAVIPKGSHYNTALPDGAGVNRLHKWVPKAITAMSPWGVSADTLQTAARKAARPWQMHSNSLQASGSSKATGWPLLIREEKEKTIFDQNTVVSDSIFHRVLGRQASQQMREKRLKLYNALLSRYFSMPQRLGIYPCNQPLKQVGKWQHNTGASMLQLILLIQLSE